MLVLHHRPDTAATVIRLVAAVAGIPVELRPVPPGAAALDTPAWRALNPTGTIPVLETPQGPVSETAAVLLWLADRHGLAPAPQDALRGVFLKWLFYLSNTVQADLMQLFYPQRYVPPGIESGHATLISGRLLTALGHVDVAAENHPGLFAPESPLSFYTLVMARWAAMAPEGHAGWFRIDAFPALHALGMATEAMPPVAAIAADEGLGPRPFTAPLTGND